MRKGRRRVRERVRGVWLLFERGVLRVGFWILTFEWFGKLSGRMGFRYTG